MPENINKTDLKRKALACYGMSLDENMAEALAIYARELLKWNKNVNLTAITEPDAIVDKHFLDCLYLACQEELRGRVVDVGTGAGFPGMVLKLYRPEIEVSLLEPNGKRLAFLAHLSRELGVKVELIKERGEEAARKCWRDGWEVAVARAVAPMRQLVEYCLPLVASGGHMLAMKGEPAVELAEAEQAIRVLGGRIVDIRAYTLPNGDQRNIIVIRKEGSTPAKYPRAGGVIKKRPL